MAARLTEGRHASCYTLLQSHLIRRPVAVIKERVMAVLARLEALVAQLERGKTLPDYPNPQVAATAILEAVYAADWRTPGKRPVAQRLVARLERLRGAAGGLNGKAPGDARPRRARPGPPP